MLCSSETLSGCKRRVEESFCSIPFLLCREGLSSCAWKWLWREHWKVSRRARGESTACLLKGTTHRCPEESCLLNWLWYDSKSVLGEINMNVTCTPLPTKCDVTVSPVFWIFARFTDNLELHTYPSLSPHLKGIVPLGAAEAHGVVCAFQSRQSHQKFPWYHGSSFVISFKLQNYFLFWKKTGKDVILEVDWSGSAC